MALSSKLLTTNTSVLMIIDYQQDVLDFIGSGDRELIAFQGKAVARAGRAFGVPTILSTIGQKLRGDPPTLPSIREELADQPEIDRNTMNAWEDPVLQEGSRRRRGEYRRPSADLCRPDDRRMPSISRPRRAARSIRNLFVADAVGAPTLTAHETAIKRMIQAGSQPITVTSLVAEWIRDWETTPFTQASENFFEWYGKEIGRIRERLNKEPFQPVSA